MQSSSVSLSGEEKGSVKKELILVPFADAGQTGGVIQVWLPLHADNK